MRIKQDNADLASVSDGLINLERDCVTLASAGATTDPHGHELAKFAMLNTLCTDAQARVSARDLSADFFIANRGRDRLTEAAGVLW